VSHVLQMRLLFLFGVTNLCGIVLVLFSCRCIFSPGFISQMLRYKWYKKYYQRHCFYWWVLIVSAVLHTTLAFWIFGIP